MPVRLWLYKGKKIIAIGLNSDIFPLILMVHCLFTFHYLNKYNIHDFRRFKENLA